MFFQQRAAANATLSYFFGCAGHAKAVAVDPPPPPAMARIVAANLRGGARGVAA